MEGPARIDPGGHGGACGDSGDLKCVTPTMLNWHGRHALRSLIPGIVHERTDRHSSHPFAGERAQQGLQWLWLVLGRVKPLVERTWVENDRHSVMQRAHDLVGIRGENRTGIDWLFTFGP